MDPYLWISLAFVLLLTSAICGGAAMMVRGRVPLHAADRFYAFEGMCLSFLGWAIDLWAATGLNNPRQVYIVATVLSSPSWIAMAAYVGRPSAPGRGFDVEPLTRDGQTSK